jgi:hypothetical protein
MNNIIENRKKVYQNFPKENLETSLADMVLFYNINETDYQNLIDATKIFLLRILSKNMKNTIDNMQLCINAY